MGTSTSAIIQVTTPAAGVAPGPPTGVGVTNVTSTSAQVSWTAPTVGDQPISYQVQYALQSSTPTWINFSTPITTTSEVVTGLQPVTAYMFQVLAENATATTASASVSATTLALLPSAPTNLAVSGTPNATDVALTWTAPTSGTPPFTYQVNYRSPSGSGPFTTGPTFSTNSGDVTGLSPATSYDFEVAAINAAGTGPFSTILSNVTTAASSSVPTAPQNPTVGTVTSNSIQVSWTASNGTQPINYTLQYRPH